MITLKGIKERVFSRRCSVAPTHKFVIIKSKFINGDEYYLVKTRHTQSFFYETLEEILSDTYILFNLPSDQCASVAIDAMHRAQEKELICEKLESAQNCAWRLYDIYEYNYKFKIHGFDKKYAIKFLDTINNKTIENSAINLIKNNQIENFNPPTAFIIGTLAITNKNKTFVTRKLRLVS